MSNFGGINADGSMNEKKNIVVTGANKGIGKAIASQLALEGHHVIIAARNIQKGKEVKQNLVAQGCDVVFKELDLEYSNSIQAFANQLKSEYQKNDVLINNGAVLLDEGVNILDTDLEVIKNTAQINLYGPIELSIAIIDLLKQSSEGRIINISSGWGAMNEMSGGQPAYRLSKVGLNAFTKILASDISNTNIKVNSMCPGWVRTDMGGSAADRSVAEGADTAVWLATADKIPNGKFLRDRSIIEW